MRLIYIPGKKQLRDEMVIPETSRSTPSMGKASFLPYGVLFGDVFGVDDKYLS